MTSPHGLREQTHTSTVSRLERIFCPRSIAVLGVTQSPGTVPHDIFSNILTSGYTGRVYPVAPGKDQIKGVRAYRYLTDIDDPVDLAVIVFPASVCDKALEQCGQKGVKAAIIIAAGFSEVGSVGAQRERRIKELCSEHGIALIGPNCLGVINTDPDICLNASFARKMPMAGRIALLSQSGALCAAMLDYARDKAIGFSKCVSFGNKADVTEIELIDYLLEDDQTDVILLYLEALRDGRALIETARRIATGPKAKPILAIKSGRTSKGSQAAASHTGSLAGEDAICEAVFRQAGIVRVTTMEELLDSAILLAYEPMPKGDRLAIVTNAGGPGVMATDAAVSAGLEMAHFAPGTTEKLRAVLPAAANMKNPVDVIGDARADRYIAGMRATLDDPNVDELLVILTPQSMTDIEAIAQAVRQVHETATKPIACSFMGAADIAPGVRILQEGHVPHYILPERACRAMAEVQRIRRWRQQGDGEPAVSLPVDRAATAAILEPSADGYLAEEQALAVLRAYGLPVPEYKRCVSAEEAVAFADRVGYPVVLRVASPRVVHKTEAQGLMLDLADAGAVRKAFGEMMGRFRSQQGAHASGAIVRKMIPRGHEVILGAKRDTVFGPTLMFGLGGIFVEVFRDVTFELAPIAPEAASRMVRQVKSFAVLKGFRGLPAADVPAIEQSLLRLGQLVSDWPCIAELDINPLIVAPAGQGAWVADVRMRLEKANGSR